MATRIFNYLLFVVYTYSFVKIMFCDRTPSNAQLMSEFMKDCPSLFVSIQVSFFQFLLKRISSFNIELLVKTRRKRGRNHGLTIIPDK